MSRKKGSKILAAFGCCLLTIMMVFTTVVFAGEDLEYNTQEELENAKVFGAVTGSAADSFTLEYFPDAEIKYYNSLTDEALALENGDIDAALFDRPTLEYVASTFDTLGVQEENIFDENYYFVLQKNDDGETLKKEFDEWIADFQTTEDYQEMKDFWCSSDENVGDRMDLSQLTGENGTIRVVFAYESRPDDYMYNGGIAGFPAELLIRFCEDRGYALDLTDVNFDALITNVVSDRADMAIGFFSWTEERAKTVLYTEPYFAGGVGVLVRKAGTAVSGTSDSFWSSAASSFKRTLIDDSRWKKILSGLGVTLMITLLGFLLANLLGALFCYLSMSGKKGLKITSGVYSKIMQGTPIVVILMILYYIVFSKSNLTGLLVASIGFGMTTGAYLAQQFEGAIRGIDAGQTEAALAIGFTPRAAFWKIVFPQAARNMLPGYFSQLIDLMKGTAVVGYIAVTDLTKAGDIIRSSTFEPFFPLIVEAVLYFAISCLLLALMKEIQKKLEPKRVKMEQGGDHK